MTDSIGLLQWSVWLLAVGQLVRAVETLAIRRELRHDGLLARPTPWTRHRLLRRLDALLTPPTVAVAALMLQVVAAVTTLILPVTDPLTRVSVTSLFFATIVGNVRFVTLRNASDVMYAIGQGGVAAAVWDSGDGTLRTVGLVFVALQVSIVYLAAGAAKLMSVHWRSGAAIGTIFVGTRYRSRAGEALVTRCVVVQPLLAWGTILLELSLGVAFLLPTPWLVALLVGGVIFHLFIALVMRIDPFLWAFVATYPAIYFLHGLVRG